MPQREDVYIGAHLDNPAEAIARISGSARDVDPVAKLTRLIEEVERSEEAIQKGGADEDPIAKNERLVSEIERSVSDPNYVTKRASEEALAKWRAEPLPPKTAGPGVPHLTVAKIEEMAKANGFGMKEADYFRKL